MKEIKATRNVGSFTVTVRRKELLKALGLTEKEIEEYNIDDIDIWNEDDENGESLIKFYFTK